MQFKRSSNLFQVSLESLFSINVFSQWILRVEAFDTWLAVIIHSQMGVGIGMCHGYQVMEICARRLCVFSLLHLTMIPTSLIKHLSFSFRTRELHDSTSSHGRVVTLLDALQFRSHEALTMPSDGSPRNRRY